MGLHDPQRKYAAGILTAESPYGSAATVDTLLVDISEGTPPVQLVADKDMRPRRIGFEGPDNARAIGAWRSHSPEFERTRPATLAWLLGLVMDAPATTALETNLAYRHDYVHDDDDYILPSATYEEQFSATVEHRYTGLVGNTLTITGTRAGDTRLVTMSADLLMKSIHAEDTWTDVTVASPAPGVEETQFWNTPETKVYIGDAGTIDTQANWGNDGSEALVGSPSPGDISAQLESFTFTISNNIDPSLLFQIGTHFQEVAEFARAVRAQRTYSLNLVLEMQDSVAQASEYHHWMLHQIDNTSPSAGVKKAVDIDWTSAVTVGGASTTKYGAKFVFPECEVVTSDTSEGDGDRLLVSLDMQPYNFTDGSTRWGPMLASVWNDAATILA